MSSVPGGGDGSRRTVEAEAEVDADTDADADEEDRVGAAVQAAGFTVTAEWVLSVLELVMELMRLPASFLVIVSRASMTGPQLRAEGT